MKTKPSQLFSKICRDEGGETQIEKNRRTVRIVSRKKHGFLQIDLLAALAVFSIAIVPLGFSFARERQVLRIEYFQSVINELVDGEMEILAAGAAKKFPDGAQNYSVHSRAAASLPPGHFELTKNGNRLRLAWLPDEKSGVSAVVRETAIK